MSTHRGWIVAGFVAAWSWAGPALGGDAAPPRPSRLYTIEQFMDTTSLRGDSFSADETSRASRPPNDSRCRSHTCSSPSTA
jgi:hypothetical protein